MVLLKSVLNRQFARQFISYFFVGLSAAFVEWGTFWLSNTPLRFGIYASTTISFFCATIANWVIARRTTFKDEAELIKPSRDFLPVFIVSGVGLGLNLLLMAFIVGNIDMYPLVAKIIATGIVFFWNFGSRKMFIYRIRGEMYEDN